MILQSVQLSPSQKVVIEELVGRPLLDNESISLCAGGAALQSSPRPSSARDDMRRLLDCLDRAERRMSVEDCEAALLESAEKEAPAFD